MTERKFRKRRSITIEPDEIEFVDKLARIEGVNFSRAISACVKTKRETVEKKVKRLAKKL